VSSSGIDLAQPESRMALHRDIALAARESNRLIISRAWNDGGGGLSARQGPIARLQSGRPLGTKEVDAGSDESGTMTADDAHAAQPTSADGQINAAADELPAICACICATDKARATNAHMARDCAVHTMISY
jgi:hypothetical protein